MAVDERDEKLSIFETDDQIVEAAVAGFGAFVDVLYEVDL